LLNFLGGSRPPGSAAAVFLSRCAYFRPGSRFLILFRTPLFFFFFLSPRVSVASFVARVVRICRSNGSTCYDLVNFFTWVFLDWFSIESAAFFFFRILVFFFFKKFPRLFRFWVLNKTCLFSPTLFFPLYYHTSIPDVAFRIFFGRFTIPTIFVNFSIFRWSFFCFFQGMVKSFPGTRSCFSFVALSLNRNHPMLFST